MKKLLLYILATAFVNGTYAQCDELFFSEYIEGSSWNKAFEIYNPTILPVNLSNYVVYRNTNGSPTPTDSLHLTGMLSAKSVWIVAHPSVSIPAIIAAADSLDGIANFNGDDALWIKNKSTGDTLDIIGQIGVDPGTGWPVGTGATNNHTLIRKINIKKGNTNWTTAQTEWDVFPVDMTDSLGMHSMSPCCVPVLPIISCPANITVNNHPGNCDSTVTYAAPTVTSCDTFSVVQTAGLPSGSAFPVGTTTNTFTVTNSFGSATCSFTITVLDSEAPTITCGGNVSSCDTIVNGIAPTSSSDNCAGQYVTYALSGATTGTGVTDASGTDFNIGTTTIWYHVTDSAGNKDSCSFDVTVHPLPAVIISSFNPDTICLNDPPVNLPVGTPASGTYSGVGVVGSTFDPSVAGAGAHYVVYSYTDINSCTNSDSTMIVVEVCVGINQYNSLSEIRLYPNPTNGFININLGDHEGKVNYSVSTIEGRIVTQKLNVGPNKMSIDLRNESKGIYLLKIEDLTSSKVYKIIKK